MMPWPLVFIIIVLCNNILEDATINDIHNFRQILKANVVISALGVVQGFSRRVVCNFCNQTIQVAFRWVQDFKNDGFFKMSVQL